MSNANRVRMNGFENVSYEKRKIDPFKPLSYWIPDWQSKSAVEIAEFFRSKKKITAHVSRVEMEELKIKFSKVAGSDFGMSCFTGEPMLFLPSTALTHNFQVPEMAHSYIVCDECPKIGVGSVCHRLLLEEYPAYYPISYCGSVRRKESTCPPKVGSNYITSNSEVVKISRMESGVGPGGDVKLYFHSDCGAWYDDDGYLCGSRYREGSLIEETRLPVPTHYEEIK